MRKRLLIHLLTSLAAILSLCQVAYAEEVSLKGRLGVGVQSNLLNFGLGPTVEFFPAGNFSLAGSFGALSDFTSYGVRGNYFFKKTEDYRPYLGAGYSQINGPEATPVPGSKLETKGSGLEIYGGLLQLASKNTTTQVRVVVTEQKRYKLVQTEPWGDAKVNQEKSASLAKEIKAYLETAS